MYFNHIPVWFVCKVCKSSFEKIDNFMEHKKNKHFLEFQKAKCIIFEETDRDQQDEPFQQSPIQFCHNLPIYGSIPGQSRDGSRNEPPRNSFEILQGSQANPNSNFIPGITTGHGHGPGPGHDDLLLKSQDNKAIDLFNPQPPPSSSSNSNSEHTLLPPTPATLILKCKLCCKKFKSDTELKTHLTICSLYNQHQSQSHPSNASRQKLKQKNQNLYHRPFVCNICGDGFKKAFTLKNHLSTHSDVRPFKCSQLNCSAAFKTKGCLCRHEKLSHSDTKLFNCPQPDCSKLFKTMQNVKSHFATHSRRQVLKCTVKNCKNVFLTNRGLKLHIKQKHIGDHVKRFSCHICKKQFYTASVLQDHYLVHSEDRPHGCNVEGCTSVFKRKRELTQHVRHVHASSKQQSIIGSIASGASETVDCGSNQL